jgi:hypothetical protein
MINESTEMTINDRLVFSLKPIKPSTELLGGTAEALKSTNCHVFSDSASSMFETG